MKTFLRQFLTLSAIAGVVYILTPVTAAKTQDAQTAASQAQSAMTQDDADSRLQRLSQELNLTDDQKTKLKPILQDESQQLQAVKSDTSMTQDQKLAKANEIRTAHKSKIDEILTPEQQQKWQQMAIEKAKKRANPPQ